MNFHFKIILYVVFIIILFPLNLTTLPTASAATNANLFVSAENSRWNNYFAGPNPNVTSFDDAPSGSTKYRITAINLVGESPTSDPTAVVPEFGDTTSIILAIALMGIVAFSARNKQILKL